MMSSGLSRRRLLCQALRVGLAAGLGCALSSCDFRRAAPEEAPADGPAQEGHEADYYTSLPGNVVRCEICWRRCAVAEGERGFCMARENIKGAYYTILYNAASALQIDPIEKEPSFHMLPGTFILCTGTAGCNNRCQFCQNWHLSQSAPRSIATHDMDSRAIVNHAISGRCDGVSFTYNEPTIFYEFMRDIAELAKAQGLYAIFHTNGSMTPQPLRELLQIMDAVTVDLKAFTESFYAQVCASSLAPVLKSLETIRHTGRHLEIVNLVIPTLNDDPDEIRSMCAWIVKNLGSEVPIHFSRFVPHYRLTRLSLTPVSTLETAAEIAKAEGIEYVYIGNVPGHPLNSTYCPRCRQVLILRTHFSVHSIALEDGRCPGCGHEVPGIWHA